MDFTDVELELLDALLKGSDTKGVDTMRIVVSTYDKVVAEIEKRGIKNERKNNE